MFTVVVVVVVCCSISAVVLTVRQPRAFLVWTCCETGKDAIPPVPESEAIEPNGSSLLVLGINVAGSNGLSRRGPLLEFLNP